MNAPFFRNDAEAEKYAVQHRPFAHAFGPIEAAYARRYGVRAAEACARCKLAAARGDQAALYLAQKALSTILYAEQRGLFEERVKKDSHLSFPRKRESSPASGSERKESLAPADAVALDPRFRGDDKKGRAA